MQTTGNLGLKKPEGTDIVDIADLNGNMDILDNAVTSKVDKVTGKQLSTNDYTAAEKTKLAGIATGANNYTHPATHPPSIIAQDVSNRFVSDTEKTTWNAKASTAIATQTTPGLESAADKIKLDGIAVGANKYVHPNHTGDITSNGDGVTAIAPGVIVDADISPSAMITWSKVNANETIVNDNISNEAYIDMLKIGTGAINNTLLNYLYGLTGGIQGQLDNKAESLTAPKKTIGNITYYVRTDGSDSNLGNANTVGGAFKTITKALSLVPQIVNHDVKINVQAGTYADAITLVGIVGSGLVSLLAQGVVNVPNVSVLQCSNVLVSGFTATSALANAFLAKYGGYVKFSSCTATASTATYSGFNIGGQSASLSSCVVSNKSTGIAAGDAATVFVSNCTGNTNNYVIVAAGGSIVTTQGTLPTGSISTGTYDAGIVQTGFVVNPWGDNTTDLRTYISAYKNADQSISAGVNTKVVFEATGMDKLMEFSTSTSRFTAKTRGNYLITVQVGTRNIVDQSYIDLIIYINGNYTVCSRSSISGSSTGQQGRIVDVLALNAGDFIEIFAGSPHAFIVESHGVFNWLRVQKIA